MRHIFHFQPERIISNARWKFAGVFVKPKGIGNQWYIPSIERRSS